ncbi:MAG: hypothetical protein O3C61_04910 [Proteobacteria bacterium]|nr:hypothetical protein [Pseudomonadota bacterium]
MIKKICIIRDDRLGDLILTLPVIETLKEKHALSITLLASSTNQILANRTKLFQKVYVFEKGIINQFKLILNMRKEKFDWVVNCSPFKNRFYKLFIPANNKISSLFLSRYKKTHIIKKLIIHWFLKKFFNHIEVIERYEGRMNNNIIHQTEIVLKLFNKIGFNLGSPKGYEYKKNSFQENKLVVIHLSNSWLEGERINDLDELIKSINYDTDYSIILTSEKNMHSGFNNTINGIDLFKIDEEISNNDKQKISFYHEPTLDDWIKVLDMASYVITPECGCSHVATMLNKKTIIIYDDNNFPELINQEYEPYKKEYLKLVFKKNNIVEKIMGILR